MSKSVDEMLRPGGVLDKATTYVTTVEQPACYVIECKKFADVLDSVRAIKNCPVTYDPDSMVMANATIERMRRYLDICTKELEALVEVKGKGE